MKKTSIYKRFALAALLAIGCTQVANAQVGNAPKRYTLGDGKNNVRIIETNADVNIYELGENYMMTTFKETPKKNIRAGATTHTLSVYPPIEATSYWGICAVSGDTYYNQYMNYFGGEGLIDVVEEGVYDIAIYGQAQDVNGDNFFFWIIYDRVEVSDDVTIQSSIDDCPYTVGVSSYTPEGVPMSELNYTFTSCYILFDFLGKGAPVYFGSVDIPTYHTHIPHFRCSAFDERSSIGLAEILFVENQTCFFIDHDPIAGCSGDIIFENDGKDLKTHEEYYNVKTTNISYYHVDHCITTHDFDGTPLRFFWDSRYNSQIFDSRLPLTVVSNVKIEDPHDYSRGYYYAMAPKVIETCDFENLSNQIYINDFAPSLMYYNADCQLVREPFHHYQIRGYSFFGNESSMDATDVLFPSPMVYLSDIGEKLFFGDRTPILYQQTIAFNNETSPIGESFYLINTTMMGDNGIQRIGDHDAIIHISLDGEEVYCDSLWRYLLDAYLPAEQPGIVTMDITDNHLVVEGIEKTNTTHTEFDLSREDAMPPTMTILQVKNQYGTESVELIDWTEAQIVFAAGDFEPHYNEEWWWFDKMQYKAKPNVEVYYSIENGEWLPLEYTENEELFHVNYGDVFTISLNQLNANVADNWVNLKFIVTDESGNTQTQELSNVFYAGEMVSVHEHTANSLQHTIYPNPFNGEVRITATQAVNGAASIAVYNVLGEQVYNKAENCTETQDFTIDGSTWKPGVYFYSISTEDGVLQGKIVKE